MGRAFEASVILGEDKKPQFEFADRAAHETQTIDPAKHEAIGLCPVCQKGQVYSLESAYTCENTLAPAKTCNFRMGKMILQREISKDQAQKLVTTGKTDLLPKFISKKGRPFSARLKLENGKVVFEFEARKPKAGAARKVAAAKE